LEVKFARLAGDDDWQFSILMEMARYFEGSADRPITAELDSVSSVSE